MASLVERRRSRGVTQERFGVDWLAEQYQQLYYGGHQYLLNGMTSYGPQEQVTLTGAGAAYASNGVVFAVVSKRTALMSQARFTWRRPGAGPKPMASDMFVDDVLLPIDDPSAMLTWADFDVAMAGNSFWVRDGGSMRRLPPQHVAIVADSASRPGEPTAWDVAPVGYVYSPPGGDPEPFMADEVWHHAPYPDPDARWRGMSYLRPVMRQASNQNAFASYLSAFWRNAATPNLILTFPPEIQRQTIEVYRDLFTERHAGASKAFRTAFLGGGADPKVIGSSLKDLASQETSAYEFAQICAAAQVPPVVVTIVPGLESASTYANYSTALRSFSDLVARPVWQAAAMGLRKLFPRPLRGDGELWYDVTGVAALQSDALDDAEIQQKLAMTMRTLVDGGYEPDSVTEAVTTGDLRRLKHTQLVSVQLLPPGAEAGPVTDEEGQAA